MSARVSPPASRPVIAIDGPSGSGKSTISRRVAAELGLAYLDTGAMFRAAAWWCLERGVDLDDRAAVAAAVQEMPLRMVTDPLSPTVFVGQTEVEPDIRSTRISTVVSKVATNLDVRAVLLRRQQEIVAQAPAGIVAEGRDVTTRVAPDADVRILLGASEEARLARRAAQLHQTVDATTLDATRDQVVRRDRDDSTVSEFRTAAEGVVPLDTSELTFEESYEAVLEIIRRGMRHNDTNSTNDARGERA